ncbi:tetratricopeptide repeat protein 4 [Caerostris darwini]|uniref:Tetratricopeptide repeat protein 4 n=1 Tax=Caerostris darwini TaxID=1538125 RepID=A0AAV4NAH9_9ARAC|nr:tetratricopeptide repeat protein 4 [Caerostris darwini]
MVSIRNLQRARVVFTQLFFCKRLSFKIHLSVAMERSELAAELEKQFEDHVNSLPKTPYKDGWSEDKWEEQMEEHPFFRTKPIEEGEELPPLVEALQELKYDPSENDPEELAESYKNDGNQHFKFRRFRRAVECYTKGIEANCNVDELNSQLYANRAAAQFHIGNYKKSLRDAEASRKHNPKNLKAYQRGALCCLKLEEFDDCVSWCNEGLNLSSEDKVLIKSKEEAIKQKKIKERDIRARNAKAAAIKSETEMLEMAIKERGIVMADNTLREPHFLALIDSKVCLASGRLKWPVLFIYPEFGTTDLFQNFSEDSNFITIFDQLYNEENSPKWDQELKYSAESVQMYFTDEDFLIPVDKTKSLKEALTLKRYKVQNATPHFLVTVRHSPFDIDFRRKYVLLEDDYFKD